jgi:rhodanese-related sulfurtransferase/peroxiredoxin
MSTKHEATMFKRTSNLMTWPPLSAGEVPHAISLTADEGTWIKLSDFSDHLNVVLVFFRSLTDDGTDAWLTEWHRRRGQFEQLETVVFGVHTARTDRLRELRHRLGLDFFLLYDPLAVESRALRCSSRVRPVTKDNVVVIGKDGKVMFADRGQVDPGRVLEAIAQAEGKALSALKATEESDSSEQESAGRKVGGMPDPVVSIDSDQAGELLSETDGGYLLIDVRTTSEFEADHSPQATHIPIDELPHRYRELGQTTRILCICQAGGRSAAAAEFLTSIGCSEIFDIQGGMSAWSGEHVTGGQQQP